MVFFPSFYIFDEILFYFILFCFILFYIFCLILLYFFRFSFYEGESSFLWVIDFLVTRVKIKERINGDVYEEKTTFGERT